MGCALYENEKTKYGRPHMLFDTLQITLSHLVLSQRSAVLLNLSPSRENYDLARVYSYNRPLVMLLERLSEEREESFKSKKFPNLKLSTSPPARSQYKLDMHSLLHVRNFWQRHFAEDVQGIGENTYASMVRSLTTLGKTPQKWDRALQDCIPANTKWYGHYSCLHPWPKSRQDLEERQSCAEDWKHIDPMTLDFETSMVNKDASFWPPLFGTIPICAEAMPDDRCHEEYNVTYLRGIAPFLELKHRDRQKSEENFQADDMNLTHWHPFLASRVHGFIHDVPDAAILGRKPKSEPFSNDDIQREEHAIPGWRHIVMIIYKPTSRQLLSVLEHAMEDYGGTSGTEPNSNLAGIWNDSSGETNLETQAQPQQIHEQNGTNANPVIATDTAAQDVSINSNDEDPTEEQIEARLRLQITRRIESYSKIYTNLAKEIKNYTPPTESPYRIKQKPKAPPRVLPALFSAEHIRQLDEAYSPAMYMAWDDGSIEYAYAYEGVIIPGGKIMLGRWWRIHGIAGMGPGREVGPNGVGVEVRAVVQPESLGDASYEDDVGRGKRKKRQGGRVGRRKTARRKRRKTYPSDEEDEEEHDADHEDEDEDYGDKRQAMPEREVEYEFVTMLNGEESRAVNACKGLERGPFVFWA